MLRTLYFFCVLILLVPDHLKGQTFLIEQLKKRVNEAPNRSVKLNALFDLCEQRQSLNTDSLCRYTDLARSLAARDKDFAVQALAEYYYACCLVKRGELKNALLICNSNLSKLANENNALQIMQKFRILKAQILVRTNQYKAGLSEIYKILNTAEKTGDTLTQMVAKNGIGWVNMEMNQGNDALRWFYKALNTSANTLYHQKNSNIYSNIAVIYKQMHRYDSAEYFVRKSLDHARKDQNIFFLANSLNILAGIYMETGRTALAETYLQEALVIRKKIGDPFYIVSDMSLMAIYYANISKPNKGIAMSLDGIAMAKKFNISSKLVYLYEALGKNYKLAGDFKNYSKTLENIQLKKDSIYEANSAAAKAEMDSKYNLRKKEDLIILQQNDIERKNNQIFAYMVLFIFVICLGWLSFSIYRKNQQISLLKMRAEEKRLSIRAVLSAQENERKRISRDLHDNIGAYATVLITSVEQLVMKNGAVNIKQAAESISEHAKNIMASLKETIWVLSNDVITITDLIDKFKVYSKMVLGQFPEITISFQEQIVNDLELSPSEALNIFRIMQEALQNAVKHAQAKNVIVRIESEKVLHIFFKDDGIGFEKDKISGGKGISNMNHRAKESGIEIGIHSNLEGTEIRLNRVVTTS